MLSNNFIEQVQKNPDNVAIKTLEDEITYTQLDSFSNCVANELIALCNVKKGNNKNIALLFEHGKDMIIGCMGGVKARITYIPLDPTYPLERLNYIIDDAEIGVVLTNNNTLELALQLGQKSDSRITIININDLKYNLMDCQLKENNITNEIAYIMYTSGSTGKPKGVYQSYDNLLHFVKCYTEKLCISKEDKMTLFSSISHDASLIDIYSALLNGVTLYPLDIKSIINFEKISKWIDEEKITIWHSVPTVYRYLIKSLTGKEKFESLRFVVLGGEQVIKNDIKSFNEFFSHTKLINLYGQTESSINSMQIFEQGNDFHRITLGEPVKETEIVVVDENREEADMFEVGEILVISDYIACGYWNNKELTKKVFEFNNKHLYWTGDLGRTLEDGTIEFIGRKNSIIKIRGYRIDIGDIESNLLQYDDITQAVVMNSKNNNLEENLYAFLVSNKELDIEKIRNFAAKKLPNYMIPNQFIQVNEIPTTNSGKIDKVALNKQLELIEKERFYEAPTNELEKKLIEIWSEVLCTEVGVNDNFFEIGGHSLKAMILISKIHKELNIELTLKKFFETLTIKNLANIIRESESKGYLGIKKIEESEYYEASSAQKRMYILQQLDKKNIAYNMPMAFKVEGNINSGKIEKIFNELVERHEALRTYFGINNGEIIQKLQKNNKFKLIEKTQNENIDEIIKNFVKPFDLEKTPLFRIELIKNKEACYLLIDMHHIISDRLSMEILIREFIHLNNGEELKPLKLQYKDFAAWQNNFLKSEEMKKQEEYWINIFSDEIPVLNMPTDYKRTANQSFEGDRLSFEIEEKITVGLTKLSKQTGTTMHMVLLSAFNILISKYSGQEDIVVGIPVAGRPHADIQNIMGMFVNTLALRNKPKGDKRYIDFLKEVKEKSLNAYDNQSYQFESLIDKLDIRRDISRNPMFDIMFNMVDVENNNLELDNMILKQYDNRKKVSKIDLTLNAQYSNKRLVFSIEYCTKLFNKETIERLIINFIKVLNIISKNNELKICEIELITEQEKNQILYKFNDTKMDYDKAKTIQQLFEEQVEKIPDNIAVAFQDKNLTYRQLNEKSNQIARILRKNGVKPNSIVGIMVERSLEMLAGIMGILKSGGAYLPIDPNYPLDRINYMIKDAQIELVVVDNSSRDKINIQEKIINVNDTSIFEVNKENLEIVNRSKDTAYVIYTSGSTGMPKGVMIGHKQVNNFIQGMNNEINLKLYKSILCITTICFDIFGLETLMPLAKGLKIVIASDEDQADAKKLGNIIEKNNVEIMQSTPSRLNMLLESMDFKDSIRGLRILLVGGEEVKDEVIDKLDENDKLKIYNVYGPTETTIWSTIKPLKKNTKISIGKPIGNTQIYIMNNAQIMTIGVPGELCIAGDGLAIGYLNRPELTKEKFVNNPFKSGTRMYKTGDLARWLPDGNIEFLGRIDNQVKIRGFRIELGEIEKILLSNSNIKEAVVLPKEDNKFLCAYIVCNNKLDIKDIKEQLKRILPQYMIPSQFIKIDKIPLSLNGKIDRKKLIDIEFVNNNEERILPRSLQENIIAQIWKEVLDINDIYVNDDFFDLGGNSINIIKVAKGIKEKLNIEISIADLMVNTRVVDLAEYIIKKSSNNDNNKYKHIFKINNSSSKKNIFILHGGDADIFYYRHLAKLLEEKYSVYGIQPGGLTGKEPLPQSFFEMLTDYIKEIRKIQKDGTYIFMGYCIGGYFSYDITKIFELQGEKVGALVEIDQEPFVYKEIYGAVKSREWILNLVELWRRITNKNKNYTIEKITKIFEKKYIVSKEEQAEIISSRKNIFEFFTKQLMSKCNYCFFSRSIKTPTIVIKAEGNHNKLFKTESWNNMAKGPLEFYEIPGGHETLLLPPYVEKLSEIIIKYLDKTVKYDE